MTAVFDVVDAVPPVVVAVIGLLAAAVVVVLRTGEVDGAAAEWLLLVDVVVDAVPADRSSKRRASSDARAN